MTAIVPARLGGNRDIERKHLRDDGREGKRDRDLVAAGRGRHGEIGVRNSQRCAVLDGITDHGAARAAGRRVDRAAARRGLNRVIEQRLRPQRAAEFEDAEHHQDKDREDERELDCGVAVVPGQQSCETGQHHLIRSIEVDVSVIGLGSPG
jgi:hypothetical protein